MTEPVLNPTPLLRLAFSFGPARVFLSAVELELFTHLHNAGPQTAAQIASALGLHARAVPDFPDTLVALGALTREGNGPDAKYKNAPEADTFFVKGREAYAGGFAEMCASRLYKFWDGLTDALKTGNVQNEAKHGKGTLFDNIFGQSDEGVVIFMEAMEAANTPAHIEFAKKFDFDGRKNLLDVGGALGRLSCEVARANEDIQCVSLDLERVAGLAMRRVTERGFAGRVKVRAGDFWKDDFDKADVIVMAMVLHDYGLEGKKTLIKKAFEALPEGGALVAIEMLIDDDRKESIEGLIMSMNMMIETDAGFDYTPSDFGLWATENGFTRWEFMPLVRPIHAVIAYK